ncbi:MAG: hypothetical protein OHK0052_03480 [Anaerolineales bacterium]
MQALFSRFWSWLNFRGVANLPPPASSHAGTADAPETAIFTGVDEAPGSADIHWQFTVRLPRRSLLFGLALTVYVCAHLLKLPAYPVYFFADEAMQPLFAERLMQNHFYDPEQGVWFPFYMQVAGDRWSPLMPIYLQMLPLLIFGKSIWVTRATIALFSTLAAIALGYALRDVFRIRLWWSAPLLLTLAPAWLLHSRTAFETAAATTWYALFLWLYLRYRTGNTKAIFGAAVCAAGAFYSYTNAQVVLGATLLLFMLTDLRFHWQQRKQLLPLVPLGLVLLLPMLAFYGKNPTAIEAHLRTVDSYWFQNLAFTEKLALFAEKYAYGISPQYWFFHNEQDLIRHTFGSLPHILTVFLPFFLIGLMVAVRQWRNAAHRLTLLAVLATPLGGTQLDVGITRVLPFVMPATLLIALGLEACWGFALRRWAWARNAIWRVELGGLVLCATVGLALIISAVQTGALWQQAYDLYGMQYGASMLYEQAIPQLLRENPFDEILVTPAWANNAHLFMDFFLSPGERMRVESGSLEGYRLHLRTLNDEHLLFVMTANEFEDARKDPKFLPPTVVKILFYPNGLPGFYVVRWQYSPEAETIFAAEQAARRVLREAVVQLNGQDVPIYHSWEDMGSPQDMFDNNLYSLMRGLEANPFIVQLNFPEPTRLTGARVNIGSEVSIVTATLTLAGTDETIQVSESHLEPVEPYWFNLQFPPLPAAIESIRLEILSLSNQPDVHIHIREIELLRP